MRAPGIPKLLSGRWAPCAALVLGSVAFVGFALLAIPERIGGALTERSRASSFTSHLARTQTEVPEATTPAWSGGFAKPTPAASPAVTRFASQAGELFPRRGFTPPLDRPLGTPPPAASPPEPTAQPAPPQQAPIVPPAPQPTAVEVAAPPPAQPVPQAEPPAAAPTPPGDAPAAPPAPPN